jgi:hypothetical protein
MGLKLYFVDVNCIEKAQSKFLLPERCNLYSTLISLSFINLHLQFCIFQLRFCSGECVMPSLEAFDGSESLMKQ